MQLLPDWRRQEKVHLAFVASGAPHAEAIWRSIEKTLDRFAGDWIAMSTEACEATRLRGTQSEALLDRRMRCLDDRLRELRAEVELFTDADANLVAPAPSAAPALPDLDLPPNPQSL